MVPGSLNKIEPFPAHSWQVVDRDKGKGEDAGAGGAGDPRPVPLEVLTAFICIYRTVHGAPTQ